MSKTSAKADPHARSLKGKRVLVVDDDETITHVLQKYLEMAGCDVLTAPNGRTGLRLIKSRKPDLLILDVVMPDMDGWQVFKDMRLNLENKDTPVLFLTGIVKQEDEAAFTQGMGNCRLLSKPVAGSKLLSTLTEML
jgi:DNA-binding response OmpR family regulator